MSNRKRLYTKMVSLTDEIGNVWSTGNLPNQSDPDNSGPLFYDDPLVSGTHIRNPGETLQMLNATNTRFSPNSSTSRKRKIRDNSTSEQRVNYRQDVYNVTQKRTIQNRYKSTKSESQMATRNSNNRSWYRNAIDWLSVRNGSAPDVCKPSHINADEEMEYQCIQLHDADGDGFISHKDLNIILCDLDSAFCVVDYCHPHCNSWFTDFQGNLRNQDCGTDGCGNKCGAWFGAHDDAEEGWSDGCPPQGYNGWNYWTCKPGVGSGGNARKFCKGQNNTPPPPPGSCFVKGTKISMADGSTKPIEMVEVGDTVKTYNEETKQLEDNKVLSLQNPIREGYFNLRYGDDDNLLGVTDEHPLYSTRVSQDGVSDMGWRSIVPESTLSVYPHLKTNGELKIGDYVLDDTLEWHKINSIEYVEGDIQTYNLWSVENTNTFFAGGILAHNRCFIADTMVLTDKGEVPIQDIRKGDVVYGYDGDELVKNKVMNLVVHQIGGDLTKVYTRKGHITGTKNHPMMAQTHHFEYKKSIFTNIEDLSIGDKLLDASGKPLEIISIENLQEEKVTYNLEVEGNKTYIANGYRVHNARYNSRQKVRHQYPDSAIHPMRNPYKEPWRFYDLDECESQYIFGFRKHPCKGDKIPAELHPERVKKLILGEPPSHTLNNERAKQRWYLEQYHKKLVSKDNMRLDSVSDNSILVSGDRIIFEDVKIHQPIIPT